MSIGVGNGCDEDGVMPVGSLASIALLEIGRSFSCDAGWATMVCDEDGVISIGVSAASTFLFFLLSLLLWIVSFGVSFLTPSCSLLTGPATGVFGGEVLELMVDQCYGMDDEGERAKRLYDARLRKKVDLGRGEKAAIVRDVKSCCTYATPEPRQGEQEVKY